MEILVSDCFPPIFSYLSLADLLNLRAVSRRLKQEVENYLPNVRSLPLYLTTRRTPEEIANYNNMFILEKQLSSNRLAKVLADCGSNRERNRCVTDTIRAHEERLDDVRQLSFGTSGQLTYEDRTILRYQNHFRFGDFLILNHSSAIPKFLPFIQKLCPNIEKLAIVIDHCEHYLPEVSRILEAFPGIKVLLVESTLQDACRPFLGDQESVDHLTSLLKRIDSKFELELPAQIYHSILKLENLEELFFFSKRSSNLKIHVLDMQQKTLRTVRLIGYFRSNPFKWRVLHFNTSPRDQRRRITQLNRPLMVDIYGGKLEELACGHVQWLMASDRKPILPSLKKFTMLNLGYNPWIKFEEDLHFYLTRNWPRPELKVLEIFDDHEFSLDENNLRLLNSLTGLERLHCGDFDISLALFGYVRSRMNPEERKFWETSLDRGEDCWEVVPEDLKNRTIKHLQITNHQWPWRFCQENPLERNQKVRRWSKYFVALETCVFSYQNMLRFA